MYFREFSKFVLFIGDPDGKEWLSLIRELLSIGHTHPIFHATFHRTVPSSDNACVATDLGNALELFCAWSKLKC